MAIVVNIDFNTVTVDVMEMVLAGFTLLQLTSFSSKQYTVLRNMDGVKEKRVSCQKPRCRPDVTPRETQARDGY